MLTLEEYEKLNPRCEITHEGTRVLFATPTVFTKWRVDSLFQKEPIKEAGIRRDLLLYDIKVQDPPESRRQAPAETQTAAPPVSNFTF